MSNSYHEIDSTAEYMAFDDQKKTNRNLCIAIVVLAVLVAAALAAILVVVFVVHPSSSNPSTVRSAQVSAPVAAPDSARSASIHLGVATNADEAPSAGSTSSSIHLGVSADPEGSAIADEPLTEKEPLTDDVSEGVPPPPPVSSIPVAPDSTEVVDDEPVDDAPPPPAPAAADMVMAGDAAPAVMMASDAAPAFEAAADTTATTAPAWTPFRIRKSSARGQLFVVRDKSRRRNGVRRVVARSFDNQLWHTVSDQDYNPVKLACNYKRCRNRCTTNSTCFRECRENACAITWPKGTYELVEIAVPSYLKSRSKMGRASKFLQQATFGPTKREIEQLTGSYKGWIDQQVSINPTLFRTHFRERVSPWQSSADYLGSVYGQCESGARYHRYAFSRRDEGKEIVISATEAANAYTLKIGGYRYAEMKTLKGKTHPASLGGHYRVCRVYESVGGKVILSDGSRVCKPAANWHFENPAITMSEHDNRITQWVRKDRVQLSRFSLNEDVRILRSFTGRCANSKAGDLGYLRVSGTYYRFDPRLKLAENSLDTPATGAVEAAVSCPTVGKNFVNAETCVRVGSACSSVTFTSKPVPLNDANLRFWYSANRKYIYYMQGLRLEAPYNISPCKGFSRWRRMGATCTETSGVDGQTKTKIRAALTSSPDKNKFIRDINLDGKSCTANVASIGAIIKAGGECFQHVHPHLYDVRDATYWASPNAHPGNAVAAMGSRPNPIKEFAKKNLKYLNYPSWHGMERWADNSASLPRVGRYGDSVDFRALPTDLQSMEMAERVGAVNQGANDTSSFSCGSAGEITNNPSFGNLYQLHNLNENGNIRTKELDYPYPFRTGKSMVWTNVALYAPDQLRQRVAWALAQIFTISFEGLARTSETEIWANYYDIFVRHAFGNYRDIMREVSFSPLMADYLSYRQNQALAVSGNYPDENYAREIMQLFTIGLVKLREDGTVIKDKRGNPVDSYTNEDIVDFARLWTGFDRQNPRGNMEKRSGKADSTNHIDPMQIKPRWRDNLPKSNLASGYLGDTYPVCDRLPARHWLRAGAKYVYTGDKSEEGPTMDAENAANVGKRGRFTATPGSPLYARLCAPDASGKCKYPAEVTLRSNIGCSSKSGQDCIADSVSTVKVVDTAASVTRYYTYVPTPCVRLAFFQEGRTLRAGGNKQCADRSGAIAAPVCCQKDKPHRPINTLIPSLCSHANEEVDYATNVARCKAAGHVACNIGYGGGSNWDRSCAANRYQWTSNPCKLQIQVYGSGRIGMVDYNATQFKIFQESSFNHFRVHWRGATFPKAPNCGPSCKLVGSSEGDTCVCDIKVVNYHLYKDPSKIPTRSHMLSSLHEGALKPSTYGAGVYVRCISTACKARKDVTIWVKKGTTGWNTDTIFELPPARIGGRRRYLFNRRSMVLVDGHRFRNPPAFMPLAGEQGGTYGEWTSDVLLVPRAEQEVDALLDHLFEHQNTAPFVAFRLIQRLVTSNPSPRYIQAVARAFKTGQYAGTRFSGKYGDLLAATHAVLRDPEARNAVVEADPGYGQLREPLLKVVQLLRSLEYERRVPNEVNLDYLRDKIGMAPFEQPSVFGFYLPEHRPDGTIADNGLVAPEVELATGPLVVGYLNGITSLIDRGLTSCGNGFGSYMHPNGRNCGKATAANVDGQLSYTPAGSTANEIVNELALILTADRMTPSNRAFMRKQYNDEMAASNADTALKRILKLFAISADFHVTNSNILSKTVRKGPVEVAGAGRKYKAIVVLFEGGGCDSFNLIVPHSGCSNGDYYAEYNRVRQGAAVAKSDLLQISTTGQVCTTFGVHKSLPTLRTLYNQKDVAFLANIGALVEPVTPADYKGTSGRIRKFPPSLFAHNVMQRSMHSVHAQNFAAKGVLGRIVNAVLEKATPFKSALFSLMGNVKMVEGSTPPFYVDRTEGVKRWSQYKQLSGAMEQMTQFTGRSAFADTYNKILNHTLEQSEEIGRLLDAVRLNTTFGTDSVSRQLLQVSKLMKMRKEDGAERDVFIITKGGWDTHNTFDLESRFAEVDAGVKSFVAEMKDQKIWNDVVMLSVSDFGRTLTSNGQGTDHAWGGNHFVASGSLKGGKIFGTYPDALTDDGKMSIGRGRVIPSHPWEYVWKAIAQWYGVAESQLAKTLPNAKNFGGAGGPDLLNRNQLFN